MTPTRTKPKQSLQYAKRLKKSVESFKAYRGVTRITASERKMLHSLNELPEARQSRS